MNSDIKIESKRMPLLLSMRRRQRDGGMFTKRMVTEKGGEIGTSMDINMKFGKDVVNF